MNRRNFFKRFGGLIATVAIAQQLVRNFASDCLASQAIMLHRYESICFYFEPSFQDFLASREKINSEFVTNPDWVDVKCEVSPIVKSTEKDKFCLMKWNGNP